ncbi:hypothetical protein JYK22_21545, partial [Nonomuraea sp. RK-328]|nr:hypothetical protein [Nonomuraea sp. RK-328]
VSVPPDGFDPIQFGRVLVTRMLTNTPESWAETADIVFYERKGDLAFHLAGLAAQLVEQLALRDGLTPLEWWQRSLAYDAQKCNEEDSRD